MASARVHYRNKAKEAKENPKKNCVVIRKKDKSKVVAVMCAAVGAVFINGLLMGFIAGKNS
ncbi:MAG: hypothetical protein LUD81_06820 [Clostridiales bacterium]|nr:hypothetical protein [Clostridiales bacterium]